MSCIQDLFDFIDSGEESCNCCGRVMRQHERKTCRFCTNLFRRISSIAKELDCAPPSRQERETIVARVSVMRDAPLDATSPVYLAFTFPPRYFVADGQIDYRLLFHTENLLFFTDQSEYQAQRVQLRNIPEDYLLSKFIAWQDTCLRITDNSSAIRRQNRNRLLQSLAPLTSVQPGKTPLYLEIQDERQ